MEELKLEDTVLAPGEGIGLTYKGAEPLKAAEMIKDLLLETLEITGAGVYDELTKWSALDGAFERNIIGEKKLDAWSKIKMDIDVAGSQDLKTKEGSADISIKPILITTVTYSNVFQRLLWDIYARMFYYNKRMEYMDTARSMTEVVKKAFIEKLGMQPAG